MFRRSRLVLAATALSFTTFALAAHAAYTMTGKSEVKISAKTNLIGGFGGELRAFDAYEKDDKLIFKANLAKMKIDMEGRDKHCHKEFGTEKYTDKDKEEERKGWPKEKQDEHKAKVEKNRVVKLVVDKKQLGDGENKTVKGQLTLRGVTKPVTVTYSAKRAGKKIEVTNASFKFNYTDFGVPEICQMKVCVEPEVTISVASMKFSDE